MKSYLEMTLLVNAVILYVCFDLAKEMLHVKFKRKQCLCICFGLAAATIAGQHFLWFVILFLISALIVFQRHFLAIFESAFLYLASVFVLQCFENIFFSRGLIYVPADSAAGVLICTAFLFLDASGKQILSLFSRAELYVPALIQTDYETVECTGLIDTGNHAMHQGLPVIFVKKSLICTECIEVTSISGSCILPAVKAEVLLGNTSYSVIAAASEHLQVDCLLHSAMK